ncbi:hypothetical protein V6N13_113971 [Hibiscus sabdariffa]|uniref:Uncharacterized protein n=1 Tax=Hibiscus sabdariffa TaxID=183260 RepID=A0ABR2U0D7_9ROSI
MAGLIQAITWTTLLTLMVGIASFVPEMALMVKRSKVDFFMPTVFAGPVVAVSACVIRSLGLWETETANQNPRVAISHLLQLACSAAASIPRASATTIALQATIDDHQIKS